VAKLWSMTDCSSLGCDPTARVLGSAEGHRKTRPDNKDQELLLQLYKDPKTIEHVYQIALA
jgi:hypothetical protein